MKKLNDGENMMSGEKVGEELVKLLEAKNNLLSRYLRVSGDYEKELAAEKYERIELFTLTRDRILQKIDLIDQQINFLAENNGGQEIPSLLKEAARSLVSDKEGMTNQILQQDMRLITLVEDLKSKVIREINASNQDRQSIRSYKLKQAGD